MIPSGAFVKDWNGVVGESGGTAGTGIQHGALRFPSGQGSALVGVTASVPADWVGEDIDIVFGGSTGGWCSGQFRIIVR